MDKNTFNQLALKNNYTYGYSVEITRNNKIIHLNTATQFHLIDNGFCVLNTYYSYNKAPELFNAILTILENDNQCIEKEYSKAQKQTALERWQEIEKKNNAKK